MVVYSRKAIKSYAYLYRKFNDIDIFVEDSTCRNVYQVLFARLFEGKYRISRIFQLGGRRQVLESCRDHQEIQDRVLLFLIDGDFDHICGFDCPQLRHLFRLNVYASENLLISENSLVSLALSASPNLDVDEIVNLLSFDSMVVDFVGKLKRLFFLFSFIYFKQEAHKINIHIQTTGFKVNNFFVDSNSNIEISIEKINQYFDEIFDKLITEFLIPEDEIYLYLQKKEEEFFDFDAVKFLSLISGKTYVLPFFYHFIRRKFRYSGTMDQMKVQLSQLVELDVDRDFFNFVQNL